MTFAHNTKVIVHNLPSFRGHHKSNKLNDNQYHLSTQRTLTVSANHNATGPWPVQVKRVTDLGPNLRRLCVTSPTLARYPFRCGGAHIKLFLPLPGQAQPQLPQLTEQGLHWAEPAQKPLIRTFSIRAFRPRLAELDIDFALHGEQGPAGRFALYARPGDRLAISNPGGPSPMLPPARYHYLAGDLTALPAISAMLEEMPGSALGQVAILVSEPADIHPLNAPTGMGIHWFINDLPALLAQVTGLSPDPAHSQFWFAGEETLVLALRRHVRHQLNAPRQAVYAIPYWRRGDSEEGYHQQRHRMMEP